jgi:hypothetical protein
LPPNSALMCYADDTYALVWGSTWGRTVLLAELAVACAVATIKVLGLKISPEKFEAKCGFAGRPITGRLRRTIAWGWWG